MNAKVHPSVVTNYLARMLPQCEQAMVYRLGDPNPPGFEDGYGPMWQVVAFNPPGRGTQQAKVSVQTDFHILSLAGSSSLAAGFRYQLYDVLKKLKLTDRGVSWNSLGQLGRNFFLREPYPLTEPNAQVLVVAQNQATDMNNIQIVMHGVARRFNYPN